MTENELNRYLAADAIDSLDSVPPAMKSLTFTELRNLLVYGEVVPSRRAVESVAAKYFEGVKVTPAPPFAPPVTPPRGPSPRMMWVDEAMDMPVQNFGPPMMYQPDGHMDTRVTEAMARAVATQRRKDFLQVTLGLNVEQAETLIELILTPIHIGGRGFGKTARADRLREMNERLSVMHLPADFMESAKTYGVLDDPEGRRLVELIFRRRNPMTDPVELTNDEGEKSLALRFDGGSQGNTAMCRFLKGTYHTHHRAKMGQREHIVIHQDDKKLPVEAGDWVITNEGWGFSVFTADEYDKHNERSD